MFRLYPTMEKFEKNTQELKKFIGQLKKKTELPNGDVQLYAKVIFNWSGNTKEDTIRVQSLSGHYAGKIMLFDENETFKDLFLTFSANNQEYEFTKKGSLKISDTTGKSKLGNYEVLIQEK
jgi:hypothetical protein